MKKMIILLSIIILVFTIIGPTVFAQAKTPLSGNTLDVVNQEEAFSAASNYVKVVSNNSYSNWKKAKLDKGFPLFDFDGNVTSYLFSVKVNGKATGYVIVSAFGKKPEILESTRDGNHPYITKEKDGYKLNKDKLKNTLVEKIVNMDCSEEIIPIITIKIIFEGNVYSN